MVHPRKPRTFASVLLPLCLGGAALAALAGFGVLARYANTPGALGRAPLSAPLALAAENDSRPRLILCAHPQCPCTAATLDELERIASRCGEQLALDVLFLADARLGGEWTRAELWRRAERIPGARVRADEGGVVARTLGAHVSGTALLYSSDGELVFHGGITRARGEAGANAGADAVVAHALGVPGEHLATAPVFGCGLGNGPAAAESAP